MIAGVEVWVENINRKGGLFGHPVGLIVADDRGDSSQHVAYLKQLVENDHVLAFVENATAAPIASGDQYLRSVGVPVIGSACANAVDDTSPVIFPQCPTLSDLYYGAVRNGVVYGGATNLAILYCVEMSICSDGKASLVDKGGAKQAGAALKYVSQVSVAQPDYASECLNASNVGAQLMLVLGPWDMYQRVVRSCKNSAGFTPPYLEGPISATFASKDQPELKTLLLAMPTFPFTGTATPAQTEFQQAMKSLYSQPPGPGESMGWTAAKEFELAVLRAGQATHLISSKTLIDALHAFNNETLGGLSVPLNFGGGTAAPASCWFPMQATGGSWSALNSGQMQCR
jgi:branched-chain amino acid transport system substrate-binding protein